MNEEQNSISEIKHIIRHVKGEINNGKITETILSEIEVIKEDIALAEADIIVNAANGCGWMGGRRCRSKLHKGVAEHINYYTKGAVEREALRSARKYSHISSWFFGHKAGDFFVTSSGGLKCKKIVHAVTMRFPASHSKIEDVTEVVKKILEFSSNSGYKSLAFPSLGCGNGGIKREKFRDILLNEAQYYPELNIKLYEITSYTIQKTSIDIVKRCHNGQANDNRKSDK